MHANKVRAWSPDSNLRSAFILRPTRAYWDSTSDNCFLSKNTETAMLSSFHHFIFKYERSMEKNRHQRYLDAGNTDDCCPLSSSFPTPPIIVSSPR